MLDGWVEDVIESLVDINLAAGRDNLNPDDEIAATNAVFSLIKSYAFRDEFPDPVLMIADSDIQYAKIFLPEVSDPYDNSLDIRDDSWIHPLGFRFQYPEYLDDDDPEPIVWNKPEDPVYIEHLDPIDCDKTRGILDRLRTKSPYYARLLEPNPEKQIQNLKALDDIHYEYHQDISYYDLDRLTNMSKYSAGNVDNVFGHRYVGPNGDRRYVVARNWLGPVGVLSLFDHAQKGVIDHDTSRYSVSSVSVSPSYRRQGISGNLMREAFKVAIKEQKYITRTTPSDMGDEYTYDFYTDLAKREFPGLSFISNKDAQYIHAITKREGFHELSFSSKCSILNDFVDRIEQMVDELERDSKHSFPYDYLDLEELQSHADDLWNRHKNIGSNANKSASLPGPST